MSKHAETEYERLEKAVMKKYGTEHVCGDCKYTTTCRRMKIQNLRVSKEKKQELMNKLAEFVTDFDIEEYTPQNCVKEYHFIRVYKCNKFMFDKR